MQDAQRYENIWENKSENRLNIKPNGMCVCVSDGMESGG